jgi:acetyl esterase
VDDCVAAATWAQQHASELGADATRICVGGDSAGANLAAVTALALARDGRPLTAQLLIYPTTDTVMTRTKELFSDGFVLTAADMTEFTQHYLGANRALYDDPRVSPARSPDLRLSPASLVVTAGFDPLRDEGEAYANALSAAGVRVQTRRESGLVHGFLHMTTLVPTAHRAVEGLARSFRTLLDETVSARR